MENNTGNNRAMAILPMKWYYFTTYIRLPFGILSDLNTTFWLVNSLQYTGSTIIGIELAICILFIGFEVFLIYTLHNQKEGGYTYIFIYLISKYFLQFLNVLIDEDITSYSLIINIIIILLLFYAEYIYFNKRRNVFIN